MSDDKPAYRIYNDALEVTHTPPRRTAGQIAGSIGRGIIQEIAVVSLGLMAYFMIMLSGLSFAEETVMGFRLEMWHALIFAVGYALIGAFLLSLDVSTPLAFITKIAVVGISGCLRIFMPAIVMLLAIIWVMALPSGGVLNMGLGGIVWFAILASPTFGTEGI